MWGICFSGLQGKDEVDYSTEELTFTKRESLYFFWPSILGLITFGMIIVCPLPFAARGRAKPAGKFAYIYICSFILQG